jgi:hypothetical protein
MERLRSLVAAGVLVTLVEAAVGVYALVVLGPAEIALYLLACAIATAVVVGVGAYLMLRRRPDGGGGAAGGGEGPQPPWWPRFEAEFRRYVRERERARSTV